VELAAAAIRDTLIPVNRKETGKKASEGGGSGGGRVSQVATGCRRLGLSQHYISVTTFVC